MNRRIFFFAFAILIFAGFSLPNSTLAQDTGNFAIEGHVFNTKNGKPLKDVAVVYQGTLDGNQVGTTSVTNASGFYQMEIIPPTAPQQIVSPALYAICRSRRRGNIRYDNYFYFSPRAEVYRRDFYITLPSGVSNCEVQNP